MIQELQTKKASSSSSGPLTDCPDCSRSQSQRAERGLVRSLLYSTRCAPRSHRENLPCLSSCSGSPSSRCSFRWQFWTHICGIERVGEIGKSARISGGSDCYVRIRKLLQPFVLRSPFVTLVSLSTVTNELGASQEVELPLCLAGTILFKRRELKDVSDKRPHLIP